MKIKFIVLFAVLLLVFSVGESVSAQSAKLSKKVSASLKKGKSYSAARKVLAANGWKPVNNFKNMPDYYREHYVVKTLRYYEMEDCSGTGMGFCNFLFKNKAGKTLTVTTGNNEDGMKPTVNGFSVDD